MNFYIHNNYAVPYYSLLLWVGYWSGNIFFPFSSTGQRSQLLLILVKFLSLFYKCIYNCLLYCFLLQELVYKHYIHTYTYTTTPLKYRHFQLFWRWQLKSNHGDLTYATSQKAMKPCALPTTISAHSKTSYEDSIGYIYKLRAL